MFITQHSSDNRKEKIRIHWDWPIKIENKLLQNEQPVRIKKAKLTSQWKARFNNSTAQGKR